MVAFLVGFGAAAVLVRLGAALVVGFVLAEANILVEGTSESSPSSENTYFGACVVLTCLSRSPKSESDPEACFVTVGVERSIAKSSSLSSLMDIAFLGAG